MHRDCELKANGWRSGEGQDWRVHATKQTSTVGPLWSGAIGCQGIRAAPHGLHFLPGPVYCAFSALDVAVLDTEYLSLQQGENYGKD
jgi:hypothetical protein